MKLTHLHQPLPTGVLDAIKLRARGTLNLTLPPNADSVVAPWVFESKLGGGGHIVVNHGDHTYRVVLEITDDGVEAHAVISAPRATDSVDIATQVLNHVRALA